MANYLDISGKLEAVRPGIMLGPDEQYEINDDKNVILKIQHMTQKSGKSDMETLPDALELFLGKDAVKQLEEKHPGATTRLSSLQLLFKAIMAAVTGETLEDADARFSGKK